MPASSVGTEAEAASEAEESTPEGKLIQKRNEL
jgi:hypothetical protein